MEGDSGLAFLEWIIGIIVVLFFFWGIKIVRPTHRGLVERLGKYKKFAHAGFNWIIPMVDRLVKVNITEKMIEAEPQEVITNDNLNAIVDAQIYYKIREDEDSVKKSQYSVNSIEYQIVNLTRTTLRNILGTMTLKSANSERGRINKDLIDILVRETSSWGIDIVRAELKQIDPPKDVQDTMNKIVKAENEKIAAVDFATATETTADGEKRAAIKRAEGVKQAQILQAEGEAEAIRLVNEAANKYFVGNAQILKRLETVQASLEQNTKIVVPANQELVNVIGDMAGIVPLKKSGGS